MINKKTILEQIDFISFSKPRFRKDLFNRRLFFLFQKITRGFSDDELYNMDIALAKYLRPRLQRFMEITGRQELKELLWVLDKVENDKHHFSDKRLNKARKQLSKNWFNLWY